MKEFIKIIEKQLLNLDFSQEVKAYIISTAMTAYGQGVVDTLLKSSK